MTNEPFTQDISHQPKNVESTVNESVFELKTPLWFQIVWPLGILGAIYFFIIPHLMHVLTFGISPNVISIIASILVTGGSIFFVGQGAVRIWCESGFSIRADGQDITMNTRSGIKSAHWHQITSCSEESRNENGELGQWITLYDEHHQVLMQWDKNWYRFTPHSIKRFDEFTQYVQTKIVENNSL